MQGKPVDLTLHAEARMKKREISFDLIRMTLESPDSIWVADYVSARRDRRRISQKEFRTRALLVVYAEDEA